MNASAPLAPPADDPPAAPPPRSPFTAWGLYSDPADPSLFVPKRIPWLGFTVNFAHPHAPLAVGQQVFLQRLVQHL
jgi:hypothetical protein